MKKVVVVGGGTGTYRVLSGLKHYPVDLTAVVAMSDSGGSTGRLRDELGVLPPGDLRNCLVALSRDPESEWLFRFRYHSNGSFREVGGHNLGNLILTAFVENYGDFMKGLRAVHRFLDIHERNRVLPVTLTATQLKATYADGSEVIGETFIDRPEIDRLLPIQEVSLLPGTAHLCKESADALLQADLIVFGPGDLYTSIIPTLLPRGMKEVLQKSSAKKVYVCNVMTKHGETSGKSSRGMMIFKTSDFLREVETYAGVKMDTVLCNHQPPSPETAQRYLREGAFFVIPDLHERVILRDLASEGEFYRHDPAKLAEAIMSLL